MSNIKTITIDVKTATTDESTLGADPVFLGRTPHGGGAGREAKLHIPVLPDTAVITLQGHDGHGTEERGTTDMNPPDYEDDGWTDVLELDSSSEHLIELEDLPRWLRAFITTADGGGSDVVVHIEGVQ